MTSQPSTLSTEPPEAQAGPGMQADPRQVPPSGFFPPPRELRGNLNGLTYPAVFLVAILATFLAAQSALSLDSGEPLRTALHIAATVWVASFLPMISATSRGRSRIRVDGARFASDRGALVVRRSLGYEIALVLCFLSPAALCAIYGIGVLTDNLTLRLPVSPWLAIAVAVVLLGYLAVYARRPEIRRLVLTPMHIVVPTKTSIGNRVSWTAVELVAVESRNNSKGTIRIESPGRRPGRTRTKRIHAEKLSIGAAGTYWLIRFYHEHPEARAELSDDRAVERLRDYGVVDPFPG
ncbi:MULTISPECIES: hypothetical protein [Nocardia]|uniref:hypothetical protein n=1 Tax=Nocardia TaxID=1817 RepID=UPI0018955275|nr:MULTISPECIES: hypothetical protein [Nocardia]MBF6351287.1 hypothetical protein [Nocardia flavorosea]